MSTLGAGLCKFDPETESFTTYRHDPDDPTSIWHDSVQFTFEDKDRNFWVAAANGLDKMDRQTGVFTHFSFDPDEPIAPSNQNIKIFYQDREGSLWLGLRRGGLRRIDPKTGQVRYKDDGTHLTIEELTKDFLNSNPHFVEASPSGAGTTSKIGDAGGGEKFDITKLDMSKPEDRQRYAEYRKKSGLSQ